MDLLLLVLLLLALISMSFSGNTLAPRWVTRPSHESEFPFVIYITMTKAKDTFCSGTLISDRWVLTAARCMFNKLGGVVVENDTSLTLYGGLESRINLKYKTAQMRQSRRLRIYPGSGGSQYFYLALVEADKPFSVSLGQGVEPFFLTNVGFKWNNKVLCKVGSHGLTDWLDPKSSTLLKKIDTFVNACNCTDTLAKVFPKSDTYNWICGQSTLMCKGDFGAGLICDQGVRGVAVNLMKYKKSDDCSVIEQKQTKECGAVGVVTNYLDVCPYLEWVHTFVPNVKPRDCSVVLRSSSLKTQGTLVTISCLIQFVVQLYIKYPSPVYNLFV